MENGILTYKDLFEIISYLVTSFSLLSILVVYVFTKKQIHFSVIDRCINEYRKLIDVDGKLNKQNYYSYIDLVNEEFFYFENNYLPLNVMIEWVDGIISILKVFENEEDFNEVKSNKLKVLINQYPRISKALEINSKVSLINKDNRKKLIIYQILMKLDLSFITKVKIKFLMFFLKKKDNFNNPFFVLF